MKERKEQQEQNIRRLVQLRNDCINENSKINERIGQIMIDTRIVLAAIASVQIEINHYRALILRFIKRKQLFDPKIIK